MEKQFLAFRTQIYPNKQQIEFFKKCFGVSRLVYNWFVENKKSNFKLSWKKIEEKFKMEKSLRYKFIDNINLRIWGAAVDNCKEAFDRYVNGISKEPKYKSKKSSYQSFNCQRTTIKNKTFTIAKANPKREKGKKVIWKKPYKIKAAEDLLFLCDKNKYRICNVTILTDGSDRFYASFKYEILNFENAKYNQTKSVGIDLGLKTFAVQNDNIVAYFPKRKILKIEQKIKRLQQILSRKRKGSKNYEKARIKLNRKYKQITNIKRDFLNKYTTWLSKNYKIIKVEDLNVEGMKRNRRLAEAVSRFNFFEFKLMLKYKTKLYGSELIEIYKFYPSSKLCSQCNNKKKELKLSERTYICEHCGLEMDRDLNAAINILNWV